MIVRFIIFAVIAIVVWRIVRVILSPARSFKCKTCRHCKRVDQDGSICMYGSKETFKNPVHIENCTDYQQR